MNERRWKQYFRQAGKYLYCDTYQKDIFEKQIRAAIADQLILHYFMPIYARWFPPSGGSIINKYGVLF